MRVLIFGASGMVGQGVLRECLQDSGVTAVTTVVRAATGQSHEKLHELVHADMFDLAPLAERLADHDACLFCLGVSSAGMSEADYRRVTYDLTLHVAKLLAEGNPEMVFCYVSGAGTDSSEKGRAMWARVKGETENALLRLPFRAAYMFRPAIIRPGPGIRSKTALYRAAYAVMSPLFPVLRAVVPGYVTTTESCGRAMIRVAAEGHSSPVIENDAINELGALESG